MSLTKTTCPYCGVGCGVLAGADGTIKGDPDHPANFGRLCSKGTALGETIDLEGRLLHPMINGAAAQWGKWILKGTRLQHFEGLLPQTGRVIGGTLVLCQSASWRLPFVSASSSASPNA